ncbi:hypothetical protein [Micromonospora endophytica]|uniref:hypothetical protein n=1 Tax=Micromonospora endophytica TaxID=515350 RepID=UPI0015E8B3F4|nr:hypothetical protein [Micromonospora endophytica]BCJ58955.1 hypothetical protein Jiend_23770 [Micromonospora endophytica]
MRGGLGGSRRGGPNIGNGGYLFHYEAGTGWKYYGDGTGYDCSELDLIEAPFCTS